MSPLKEINQQAYYNAINRSTDAVIVVSSLTSCYKKYTKH